MTGQENADGWAEKISDALVKAELPETARAAVRVARRHAARARMDAMKAIAADIPDPEVYARYVPLEIAEAITGARFKNNNSYEVAVHHAAALRSLGLVEFGGRCLTAFGIKVRRALMDEAD